MDNTEEDDDNLVCPCANPKNISKEWIFCDNCHTWFHPKCVGLSDKEVTELALDKNDWLCTKCKETISSQQSNDKSSDQCPFCPYIARSSKGLKIHIGHKHKSDNKENTPTEVHNQDSIEDYLIDQKNKTKILKRIPKGARHAAAVKLSKLLESCVEKNDISSWKVLFSFAFICLCVPEKTKNQSLCRVVKRNINEMASQPCQTEHKKTTLSRRIESKVAEGDIRGAVKLLSSTDSLAPDNEQTYELLLEKHPRPPSNETFPDPPTQTSSCLQVEDEHVIRAISSFPNGSSSGIDGLRPQHLKDMISLSNGLAALRLIKALTEMCNFALKGKINPEVLHIFFGANLCALNKKDGGIRPIACGNTLRRLVAKLACTSVCDQIGPYLRPKQLGFATRGGCEAIVHATREYLQENDGTGKVLLKIDFKNAFNSVHRGHMLKQVETKTPTLFPFFWQAYSKATTLFFKNWQIGSESIQQGDPGGTLLFSLAIHEFINLLSSELVMFYLDDGTIGGDPESVLNDFNTLIHTCHEIGLSINPSKCEIYSCGALSDEWKHEFEKISPGIKFLKKLALLGAPLTDNFIVESFKKKQEEVALLTDRLRSLRNSHISYYLLRNCFAIPKMMYLIRTTPLWGYMDLLNSFDQQIRKCLEYLLNSELSSSSHTKATLPIKNGGIGIRKIKDLCLPAYLSSVHATAKLVNLMLKKESDEPVAAAEAALQKWYEDYDQVPECTTFQKTWDGLVIKKIEDELNRNDDIEEAIYLANKRKESYAWLSAIPSRSIGTLLDNNTFRIIMGLRLSLKICKQHTCICGVTVDEFGRHGLSCSKNLGRYSRHQELNNIILRALTTAKFPARLEPCGLSNDDAKRPDGMTLIPWHEGKCLAWDATCSDTLAVSYRNLAIKESGLVAEHAASMKTRKYSGVLDENLIFLPFAVETFGPWSKETIDFM